MIFNLKRTPSPTHQYPSRLIPPKNLTKMVATREPRPVFSNPCKQTGTNHVADEWANSNKPFDCAHQHPHAPIPAPHSLALAKKKETTMSQMTSFVKAVKACAKVRVLVATATVTPRNAQAPTGSGSSTRPGVRRGSCSCGTHSSCHHHKSHTYTSDLTILQSQACNPGIPSLRYPHFPQNLPAMVLTKMESNVHASVLMPAGMGAKKRIARPKPTDAKRGTILAPCLTREERMQESFDRVFLPPFGRQPMGKEATIHSAIK